jgi:hypothetical protein
VQEVSFSCKDMGNFMDLITSASARAEVFKQVIISSVTDRANVSLLETKLNPRDLDNVIKQMGVLYYFDPQHPTGHYLLDLSEQTHFDLAGQLMVINAGDVSRDGSPMMQSRRLNRRRASQLTQVKPWLPGHQPVHELHVFSPCKCNRVPVLKFHRCRYFRNCRLDGNPFFITGFWRLPKKGVRDSMRPLAKSRDTHPQACLSSTSFTPDPPAY